MVTERESMTLKEMGARALEVEERSDETSRARASGNCGGHAGRPRADDCQIDGLAHRTARNTRAGGAIARTHASRALADVRCGAPITCRSVPGDTP